MPVPPQSHIKKATPIITDWNGTTMKNTNHESYNMILTLCYFVA